MTSRALVLGLVLLVLLISYGSSLRAWLDQRQQEQEARDRIAAAQAEVDSLEREKRRWADDAYVMQQARERLGFVLPGERAYRVLDADGEPLDAAADPQRDDVLPEQQWYDQLWTSSRKAGR